MPEIQCVSTDSSSPEEIEEQRKELEALMLRASNRYRQLVSLADHNEATFDAMMPVALREVYAEYNAEDHPWIVELTAIESENGDCDLSTNVDRRFRN